MSLRNPVLFELRTLPTNRETVDTLQMDEAAFQTLYEQTAKPVWAFLFRRTGSEHLADDLLQETYYRFLCAKRDYESAAHRRNYLFRIAANVANDTGRKRIESTAPSETTVEEVAARTPDTAIQTQKKTDLARAMQTLPSRQRNALWLAYAEGSTHREIADILGLRPGSVKPLLFRARTKLAAVLRSREAEERS